jgi:beta-N-acetylhexosaminidase
LASLSIEQAAGQKLLLSFPGFEPSPEILAALESHPVAGVTLYRSLNIQDPAQVRALAGALQRAAAQAGQPLLLIAADQEGGQLQAVGEGATAFPGNMALGAAGSEELARRAGQAAGRELAAMGINVNYAPVCDVLVNPRNTMMGTRAFGEDPALVSRLGAALVEGLQSAGVAATAKHFPGYGDTAIDGHYATPVLLHDEARLRRVELPPFSAAIQAGVKLVMTAHVALPALNAGLDMPATLSPAVLRGLLRQELGFQGVIASDALDMQAIRQGPALLIDALAAAAAGLDLLLFGPQTVERELLFDGLVQAARRGLLDPEDVRASAGRVLALKSWLAGREQPPLEVVGCAEHQALALEIARRSVTLVRDAAGLLPLRLSPGERLLAVLPQPADLTPAETSSYLAPSLAQYLRRFHPETDEIILPTDPAAADIAGLLERARGYARVVACTFEASAHPGQVALAHALLEQGPPTIIAALRMPFDLQRFPEAPTTLCTYSVQPPALQALAEALCGQIATQGRLPVTISTE